MSFSVELPMPPTINNAFIKARHPGKKNRQRIKSPEYRAWTKEAVAELARQVPAALRIGGKVVIYIALPEKMAGDVDNRIKPVLDALVASGRIDDDANVVSVTASKTHDKPTALVRVARYVAAGAAA